MLCIDVVDLVTRIGGADGRGIRGTEKNSRTTTTTDRSTTRNCRQSGWTPAAAMLGASNFPSFKTSVLDRTCGPCYTYLSVKYMKTSSSSPFSILLEGTLNIDVVDAKTKARR